jgi:hypothetical protein
MTNAVASSHPNNAMNSFRDDDNDKELLHHQSYALETDVEDAMEHDNEGAAPSVQISISASNHGNFLGIYTYSRVMHIVPRILLGVLSICLGLLTVFPNVMMSDSGTKAAQTAATIGMISSFLFMFAGIAIFVRGAWIWMLIALACQVLAFMVW